MNKQQLIRTVRRITEIDEATIGIMIALGLSDKAIMETVRRATPTDIQKVAKRIGLKRRDYRDNRSPTAKFVVKKASDYVHTKYVEPKLLTD